MAFFTKHAVLLALLVSGTAQARLPEKMIGLTTGSRVATWSLPSDRAQKHKTPVIFLHGGPGLYTEDRRFEEGAVFRQNGFDTVYFDQAGGGRSDHLPVTAYSLDRAVADLEALRIALGKDRLILWGNSYGASLATLYAQRHPDRVVALIFTAPGMFPGFDGKRDYSRTARDKVSMSKAITQAIDLIDRSPAAAEAQLSQKEAGLLFDQLVADELIDGVVCKRAMVRPPSLPGGGNLYAQRILSRDVKRTNLQGVSAAKVPTLILRGTCDFLPLASAQRYAAYFAGKLVSVPNTGHGLLEDRKAVDTEISAFLSDALKAVP